MLKRSRTSLLPAFLLLGAVGLLWLPDFAFAQSVAESGLSEFATQAGFGGTSDIRVIIARLIRTALSLAGIVLVAMVIYAGFQWLTAGGKADKIDTARKTLFQAVVGLIIVLSAFAITQFVLSSVLGATGGREVTTDTPPRPPGCPDCPPDPTHLFLVESWSCLETLSVLPQNVQTQILFNRNVQTDANALATGITVKAGSTDVAVDVSGSGQVVTVAPNGSTCPDEAGNVFCEGTTYRVTVTEGFQSADGVKVSCTIGNPCSYDFTTSDVIDTTGPTIVLNQPVEGSPVFSYTGLDVQAQVTDDSGVGVTTFTVNSAYVDSAGPTGCEGDGPMSCLANGLWVPGDLTPGSTHAIRATGADCSGNTATSEAVTVIALAPHCDNAVQDEDEEGVDCGGADCLDCDGSICTDDTDCASGLCLDGTCVTGPRITNVAPQDKDGIPNGAPGNFITISGSGFGATSGTVTFLGVADDDTDDVSAGIVSCPTPAWSDTQIIVAVPETAANGAIRVTTGATSPLSDATDDTVGPIVHDFEVNTTIRPGLCAVSPNEALPGTRITVSGDNFGTDPDVGTIYFVGQNVYEALFLSEIDTWTNDALKVLVPPSTAGEYDLRVFVDGEGSNPLDFDVTTETSEEGLPRIDYIDSGVFLCEDDIDTAGDLCATDADCGSGSCVAAGDTGAPGQYLTVFGSNFGTATGTVLFSDEDAGDVTFVPSFPPQCGGTWWGDTQIVVQIPERLSTDAAFNPKTLRVRTSEYPTTAESNTVEFRVDAIDVTPGLCALSPTAGPIGTAVTFYGTHLGETAASFEARFYDGSTLPPSVAALESTESYTSSNQVGAQVPAGAATGPTAVSADALLSNTLSFQVGDCNAVEGLCSASQVCCASGVCAANISECSGDPVDAQYVYKFTTGPIPNAPTVIEQCNDSVISPSPSTSWEEGTRTCVNGNVMVAFNPGAPATAMDETTLKIGSNVFVDQCIGDGVDPCEVLLETDEGLPQHVAGVLTTTPTTVSFDPDSNFETETWYQVTMTSNVMNANNVALADDYVFRFRTRRDATECEVEELLVSPADYTAVSSDAINYEALPTNGSCQVLDADDYDYDWSINNYGKDIRFPGDLTTLSGVGNTTDVLPKQETAAGQPALVTAGVVGFSTSDTEKLTVDFQDPFVTSAIPQCGTACVNALVRATFNTAMTASGETGLLGSHDGEDNVRLFECTDEICDTFVGAAVANPLVFVNNPSNPDDGRELFFKDTLEPNTYYRVLIWGGVESEPGPGQTSGVPLTSLNYGEYYSWTFKTRTDAQACGIASVDVSPSQLLLDAIGARGTFSAVPFGEPDSCSLAGQELNPFSYPWDWLINTIENPVTGSPALIASFLPDHGATATLDTKAATFEVCTASCLNAGSQAHPAICTNGVVEQDPLTKAWEDCDPLAPGWSSAECSRSCQVIGVTACDGTTTTNCCGNGVKEGREECDDGGNEDGNGCSSTCLNEGASAAGLTCGDGFISHSATLFPDGIHSGGEECDDGNTISGDGCSSVCLREGSSGRSPTWGIITCGDGVIGYGEDCDDGNSQDGDGCSHICLQEPLVGSWTFGSLSGVCGNGTLEPSSASASGVGEECDDGNAVDGDGCSRFCLNEGSSIFYETPSFCEDGTLTHSDVTGGEECEVTSLSSAGALLANMRDGVGPFDPVQHVEIESVAAQTVVNGQASTKLRATAEDTETGSSGFGDAVVGLTCSCERDADCGNNTARGCGLNGCCFERPQVDAAETFPLTTSNSPLCRNTLVQARFTDQMAIETLFAADDEAQPNVFLELMATTSDWADLNRDGMYKEVDDGPLGTVTCPSSYLSYDTGARNGFSRFLRGLVRVFRPTAWAQTTACVIPAQLLPATVDVGTPGVPQPVTEIAVQYNQALEPGAVYRLVIVADSDITDGDVEGVASAWNVTINGESGAFIGPAGGYSGAWSNIFTTSSEICTVDEVLVEDLSGTPGLLSVAGESHTLRAKAYHQSGPMLEPVVKLPGLYAWDWSGVDGSITWGWTSSLPTGTGDVVVETEVGETDIAATATVTTAAPAINGLETVQAQLRVEPTTDPSIDTPGRMVSGGLEETVFLCENPWPGVGAFPFVDTDAYATLHPEFGMEAPFTSFSFFYCRDAGESGDTSDDLPGLNVTSKATGIETPDLFKEYIFSVDDPDLNDAVGVRILANGDYLSSRDWFEAQGFVGAPTAEVLDGFDGVRDERTLYVAAPNVSVGSASGTSDQIFSNMYVVAYSEGASDITREIYKRLLQQWEFVANDHPSTGLPVVTNKAVCTIHLSTGGTDPVEVGTPPEVVACTSDADCAGLSVLDDAGAPVVPFCDAQKDKLRRDYRRLNDVRTIGSALEAYGDTHRRCSITKDQICFTDADCSGTETCEPSVPTLSSGTFIPSMSSSTWPSWQAQLANELGVALPTDPLNTYANCPDGYDAESCYNALEAVAQCPDDSYVYTYRSIGGETYQLEADLEYGSDVATHAWAQPVDTFGLGDFFIGNAVLPASSYPVTGDFGGFESAPNCQSTLTLSAANICGDGNLGGGEVCEVGETSTVSCAVNVCTNATDLSFNGRICTSGTDCGPGGSCGATEGVKTVRCYAPGDAGGGPGCNGYQTVDESDAACVPYFCGDGILDSDGPDNILGNADDEICDDGPLNGQYGFCGTSCSWAGAAFCGDGLLGGAEICDCGLTSAFNASADATRCTYPSGSSAGQPLLNGTYYSDPSFGCSATCSGPAGFCGDGRVSGGEQCDGGVEQWGGALCANGDPCTTDADCSAGSCGAGRSACPLAPGGIDQVRSRICQGVGSGTAACMWPTTSTVGGWGSCEPTGACGDGIVEGDEECDDGNESNTDACLNTCRLNICGDGYRNAEAEACDLGIENGELCAAEYGGTCTSCSTSCTFLTQTGGYCGDNVINGGEYCDGTSIPARCFKGNVDPDLREIGGVCSVDADCLCDGPDDVNCGAEFTCEALAGFCNGGERRTGDHSSGELVWQYNGAPCVADESLHSLKCGYQSGVEGGSSLDGQCIPQDCNNTCSQACPFTLELGAVQIQTESSGVRTGEADLYSYLSSPAVSPDEATLFFPACTVGSRLLADVDFANVVSPRVDVLFLLDLSGSMNADVNDNYTGTPTRLQIVQDVLPPAFDELLAGFSDIQIGLATFAREMEGASGAPATFLTAFNQADCDVPGVGDSEDCPTAGTVSAFTSSATELSSALLTLSANNGTPTADGLDWAYDLFLEREGNPATAERERVLILLTDGSPGVPLFTNYAGETTSGDAMQDAYQVSQKLQNDLGVRVYSAAFVSSASSIARVDHLSSNDCGTDFSDQSDCLPRDGVDYARDAQSQEAFGQMIEDIVSNILGLQFSYLTDEGFEGGAVQKGSDIELPFPPGFRCEAAPGGGPQPFEIPVFLTFNSGDPNASTVNLSNLRLEYCPFR